MSKNYTNAMTSLKTVIHDTSFLDAQKISVNPGSGNFDERIDVGSNLKLAVDSTNILNAAVLGNKVPNTYATSSVSSNLNYDAAQITAIRLSRAHCISGTVTKISVPYTSASRTITTYLSVQIFLDDNDSSIFYSENTATQTNGQSGTCEFTFNNLELPVSYKFIQICFVDNKSQIPNVANNTGCTGFKCRVIQNRNESDVNQWDADECSAFVNTSQKNWLIDVNFEYLGYVGGLIESVDKLNRDIDGLDKNNIAYTNKVNVFSQQLKTSKYLEVAEWISVEGNITAGGNITTSGDLTVKNNLTSNYIDVDTFDANYGTIAGYLRLNRDGSHEIYDEDILTRGETDERYVRPDADTIFTGNNSFEGESMFTSAVQMDAPVTASNSINVIGGNIFISKGSQISFLDDGEVTITNGASGYPIYNGIPSVVSNGTIYNIGTLDSDVDLSGITFDGDETLVQSCEIWFTVGTSSYNITWPENTYWIDYDDGAMPSLFTNMKYRIVLRREIDDIVASISHYYAVR